MTGKKMLMITVGVGLGYKVIYSTFPPPPQLILRPYVASSYHENISKKFLEW